MLESGSGNPLDQKWLVLDRLLNVLNGKYDVPGQVTKDLQYARSLTNYYNDDPTDSNRINELPKIESFLNDAERNLMIIAEGEGDDFVDEWNKKLFDASQGKEVFKDNKIQSKFIPGMPANFDFVRFNFKEPVAEERFYEICEYENVIVEYDDNDSSIFIFGEKSNINNALKEMSSFFTEQLS